MRTWATCFPTARRTRGLRCCINPAALQIEAKDNNED